MNKKIKLAVLFGGESTEHEVSLMSAKNVLTALDKSKYEITKFLIPKTGNFNFEKLKKFDVVFPVLHGKNGEDGTIQGLLQLAHTPYVGADVLGSAIGMDKDVQKRLLRDAHILTAKFAVICHAEFSSASQQEILKQVQDDIVGFPVFVKPANSGSSVGVCKVKSEKFLKSAVREALKFDKKVLIEEAIEGREIEISVLGNDKPVASLPGEIIPTHEFYDYDAKYIDENGARLVIPAKLTNSQIKKCQQLAIKTYKVLCCKGMARVDMFLTKKGFVINEINTIPGFTKISMYPKLWEASGLPYSKLLDKLISLAFEN